MSILGETQFIGTSVLTEQNKAVIRNEFLPAHKASGAIHTFYFQTSHTSYTVVALWKDTETRDAGLKSLAPVFEHAASMGFHRSHSVVGENFCRFGSGPSHDGYVTAWNMSFVPTQLMEQPGENRLSKGITRFGQASSSG